MSIMQQPLISPGDKKYLDKYIRTLCLKATQIIVQGRTGKMVSSQCSPSPTGAFNLAIDDTPEVLKVAQGALFEGNPNFVSSYIVEISLRTSDSESLTLELWSFSIMKKYENARVHHTVYNRMSLLLKSLMCVSRATPAYKLSQKQGLEYIICYKIYTGEAKIAGLGDGFKTLRVGSIGTPTGTIALSVAFRTSENLHVSTKRLAPEACGPMKVSVDHFCSPSVSPARPCHTLRSRLMNSREFSSGSQSSSGPLESPSYSMLPTSFSTSPGEMYMETSRHKGAFFTIGTPPSTGSAYGRTPPRQTPSPLLSGSRRRLSGATPPEARLVSGSARKQYPFLHSQSEQNFSDPVRYQDRKEHRRKTIQEETFHAGKVFDEKEVPGSSHRDSSLHSTLKNEENVFRPISYSPSDETPHSSSTRDRLSKSGAKALSVGSRRKSSHIDTVMALKSNSPTNAKVGFPDNTATTSHLSHIPPLLASAASSATTVLDRSQQHDWHMPSPGAFVSNSKTAKRAYNTLSEISSDRKLPFEDLLFEGTLSSDKCSQRSKSKCSLGDSSSDSSPESIRENTRAITRLSSQSTLSSHSSSESSPPKQHISSPPHLVDEFLMIDLNPAFGRSVSAKDLCAFYRDIENAPDLLMFQENNGQETQETLLDLTKQLEDYQRDAEGFDEFIKELEAM